MLFHLHKLRIALRSQSAAINLAWEKVCGGWLSVPDNHPVDIVLQLEAAEALPALPDSPPIFKDADHILNVYAQENDSVQLHYLDGALVNVPLAVPGTDPLTATGVLTKKAMQHGRFEDITFTSLAPLLRRRGYFLAHAFAASKNGQAIIIVGPSHSGKTTTGLSLLLDGWQLITNDILLLESRPDGVYALPTPGVVGIRPKSLELLPGLGEMVQDIPLVDGHYNLSGERAANGQWADPCPVTAVYFPHIEERAESELTPQNSALALVQLMTESIDRWDGPLLQTHMAVLEKLSQQAATFNLHLGRNVAALPDLLTP